jgi:hypothetical protein
VWSLGRGNIVEGKIRVEFAILSKASPIVNFVRGSLTRVNRHGWCGWLSISRHRAIGRQNSKVGFRFGLLEADVFHSFDLS